MKHKYSYMQCNNRSLAFAQLEIQAAYVDWAGYQAYLQRAKRENHIKSGIKKSFVSKISSVKQQKKIKKLQKIKLRA